MFLFLTSFLPTDSHESVSSTFIKSLGKAYFVICASRYERAYRTLGPDFGQFLINLDGVLEALKHSHQGMAGIGNIHETIVTTKEPTRVGEPLESERYTVVYKTTFTEEIMSVFFSRILTTVCRSLYSSHVTVELRYRQRECREGSESSSKPLRFLLVYDLQLINSSESAPPASPLYATTIATTKIPIKRAPPTSKKLSQCPSDLVINVQLFSRAFPWHFVLDRNLRLVQLGSSLLKLFAPTFIQGQRNQCRDSYRVTEFFQFVRPDLGSGISFETIFQRLNTPFLLRLVHLARHNGANQLAEGMELKGQMVDCWESQCLLFLGSPLIDGLEGLTTRGLYISDIPIHDATRDVILVGEQSRAQDGLKRRMDKLRQSIEEASTAVDREREKNVSLLHLIFPPDIAKRLWLGETIEAKMHENVTMLFSDIVGFTSICSTATPMMVVNMLQNLYTQFDAFCGILDVYKVETIGDAYCVAGGLHRRSPTHAQQISWMSIKMQRTCVNHQTHDGQPIRMRIGLHTGSVLAGVVGVKMPRYCLFGNNVTLANKFESGSEPLKINVSPTTHRFLMETPGFTFEARERECLPKGFPPEIPGTCHFLVSYKHPSLPPEAPDFEHIHRALQDLNLEPQ
ncbi:unnamed protein product [Allacma fusca]|uniref:guanylate cyclase n=1 Tax=Allacma fusca TaxID=39272 RepID=A0A8J2L159_9HEXA|nr:unnamed protein product [Allacma fusca]